MRVTILILLLIMINLCYAITDPIIVVNKSTPDYINAKPLLDKFYNYYKINTHNNTTEIIKKSTEYIFSNNNYLNVDDIIIYYNKTIFTKIKIPIYIL